MYRGEFNFYCLLKKDRDQNKWAWLIIKKKYVKVNKCFYLPTLIASKCYATHSSAESFISPSSPFFLSPTTTTLYNLWYPFSFAFGFGFFFPFFFYFFLSFYQVGVPVFLFYYGELYIYFDILAS